MKTVIVKIVWLGVMLNPLLVWFFIYRFWVTEYDDNLANLFLAICFSLFTAVGLLWLRLCDKANYRQRRISRLYANLLGTPLAFVFLWLYMSYFQMRFLYQEHHVKNGQSYTMIKWQNFFKAENMLINNDLSATADSTIAIVRRNGEIQKIWRVVKGDSIEITAPQINYLSKEQKKALLKY